MQRDNTYLIGNKFAKGNKPNQTSFKKGAIPWNKTKKGIHLSPKSEFKKGIIPKNKVSIGTIKIRTDHKKRQARQRRWIKIEEPNRWILYTTYVWMQTGNLLIKGMVIHHKDHNTLNDDIKNLEQLSKKDHMNVHRGQLRKKVGKLNKSG